MRAIKAKQVRRQVYGKGHHPGPVKYFRTAKGEMLSDSARRAYQKAKKVK
jgi:hypothetical protein